MADSLLWGMVVLGLAAAPPAALARRHALLIGAGTYSNLPHLSLQAPREDVNALARLLKVSYGFAPADVTVVLDQAATRAGVLAAIDSLIARVSEGDDVFLYYSGHGTSGRDPLNPAVGMPLDTGALVPTDMKPGRPQDLLRRLVVGRTDLRPRLLALDRKANTLVVFDSCYSGSAVKAVADGALIPRGQPLTAFSDSSTAPMELYDAAYTTIRKREIAETEYPYRNTVFLSAAADSEKAFEIGEAGIRNGILHTVDGRPHGVLTNALLRGLAGGADSDRDRKITHGELYQFVYEQAMLQQTPQLLPRERTELTGRAVFGASQVPRTAAETAGVQSIAVSLSPAAAHLRPSVEALAGVRIAPPGGASDLAVTVEGEEYVLYVANGVRIASYTKENLPRLLLRVGREPGIRRLRSWVFPAQAFPVSFSVEPSNLPVYPLNKLLKFHVSSGHDSWMLLLNIDVTGEVTIVHASPPGTPERAGEDRQIAACVRSPAGTEFMKLVAFRDRFDGFPNWRPGTSFSPDDPRFRELLDLLEKGASLGAQAVWTTYSTDRRSANDEVCLR